MSNDDIALQRFDYKVSRVSSPSIFSTLSTRSIPMEDEQDVLALLS